MAKIWKQGEPAFAGDLQGGAPLFVRWGLPGAEDTLFASGLAGLG